MGSLFSTNININFGNSFNSYNKSQTIFYLKNNGKLPEIYLWGKQIILPNTNKIIFEYKGKIKNNYKYPMFFVNSDIDAVHHNNGDIYIKKHIGGSVTTSNGSIHVNDYVSQNIKTSNAGIYANFINGKIKTSNGSIRKISDYLRELSIHIPRTYEDSSYIPVWPESFKITINNEEIKFDKKTIEESAYNQSSIVINGNVEQEVMTSNANIKVGYHVGGNATTSNGTVCIGSYIGGNATTSNGDIYIR